MAVVSKRLAGMALASGLVLLSAAAATPAAASLAHPAAARLAVARPAVARPAGAQAAGRCCRNAPPWRGVTDVKLRHAGWFVDVEATSRTAAWAVGDTFTGTQATGGVAARWNGKRWSQVKLPLAGFVPVSVSARKGSSVWIFGYQNVPATNGADLPADAVVWRAGHWHVLALPSAGAAWDVLGDLQSAVLSDDDVWVTGNRKNSLGEETDNIVWNWNGSSWTGYPLHVLGVRNVSGPSGDNVWVAAQRADGQTVALRWNGVAWRKVRVPSISVASVVADSARNVWLTGAGSRNGVTVGAVEHWNGKRWARTILDPVLNPNELASNDGHGGVWFSDFAHESRGVWHVPRALPSWHGCRFGLGTGMVAAIPGTSAAWFAGVCDGPAMAIDGHL
jgi:hypothetical protein